MLINDFDKIYVLHLAERKDRYAAMEKEFKRMSLWDNISIWWTCKRNVSIECGNYLKSLHTEDYDQLFKMNPNLYGGVFNCSFEHMSIIKTSYERGMKHIMILEDDICFYGDRDYFNICLSKLSPYYPICKLYYTLEETQPYDDISKDLFSPIVSVGISSTAAYVLNRDGMKMMIDIYESQFPIADLTFLHVRPYSNLYINNYKICYINNSLQSDII